MKCDSFVDGRGKPLAISNCIFEIVKSESQSHIFEVMGAVTISFMFLVNDIP